LYGFQPWPNKRVAARAAHYSWRETRIGAGGRSAGMTDEADQRADTLDGLRAENARLSRELAMAAARIADLEFRAEIDALTDVRNRQGFERELKRSLAYIARYEASAVLLYLDLDRFKAVNDGHGHAAGDAVLRAVAATLTRHVRASDVVARLAGDEFAVLMWNADVHQAEAKGHDLERRIAELDLPAARSAGLGASAGVVPLKADLTASQILDAADRAMYARKRLRKDGER